MGVGIPSLNILTHWIAANAISISAHYCSHAAVRVFVMGERAIRLENANQADIAPGCVRSLPTRSVPALLAFRPPDHQP